jgi:hypothetical protein
MRLRASTRYNLVRMTLATALAAVLILIALAPRVAAEEDPVQCHPTPGASGCDRHGWRYSLSCLSVSGAADPGWGGPIEFQLLWDGCSPGGFPRVTSYPDGDAICAGPREECAWVADHEVGDFFAQVLILTLRSQELADFAGWHPTCVPGACLMLAVRVANGTVTGVTVKHVVQS